MRFEVTVCVCLQAAVIAAIVEATFENTLVVVVMMAAGRPMSQSATIASNRIAAAALAISLSCGL